MVRSVPRVTCGWYPASRIRSMTWSISFSVAFSDMFTIMASVSLDKSQKQKPRSLDRGLRLKLGWFRGPSVAQTYSKLLRSRYLCKPEVGVKKRAWSKSCHRGYKANRDEVAESAGSAPLLDGTSGLGEYAVGILTNQASWPYSWNK